MPCAAAAAVTSGSFAAPSSIEYSVWTCRCTNESDSADRELTVLLTGGAAPQGRACPAGRNSSGRPAGKTRSGGSILALPEVYSEGLTGRVFSHADRSVTSAPCARSGQLAAHGDVRD